MSGLTKQCRFCGYADPKRKCAKGYVRCTRYSQWVDEFASCNEYMERGIKELFRLFTKED